MQNAKTVKKIKTWFSDGTVETKTFNKIMSQDNNRQKWRKAKK